LRRLINYSLSLLSISYAIVLAYLLFLHPISIGRLLMYIFLLTLLILIGVDLGSNKALSKKIDRCFTRRLSLIIQSLIVVIPLIILTVLSMNYVSALIESGTRLYLGEIYVWDMYSIYLAAIPVAAYIIYYYAELFHNYLTSKIRDEVIKILSRESVE